MTKDMSKAKLAAFKRRVDKHTKKERTYLLMLLMFSPIYTAEQHEGLAYLQNKVQQQEAQ